MSRETPLSGILEELEAAGVKAEVERNKHYKIRFEVAGRKLLYTCAATTSDRRAVLNARCDVRRLIREAKSVQF